MASWYYEHDGQQVGPVEDETFESLVETDVITDGTLVWRDGMEDWQHYGLVRSQSPGSPPVPAVQPPAGTVYTCAECGREFSADEMVEYGGSWICAACKPLFFQRLKEGGTLPGTFRYAGFWIRAGAKIVDGVIMGICSFVVNLVTTGAVTAFARNDSSPEVAIVASVLGMLIQFAIGIAYTTWFLGTFGATPGKMACGIKVVRPDGSPITYMRAFGRYFGDMLSALVLYIGYIMVAFDDEKRALHDRICDTRVVYK